MNPTADTFVLVAILAVGGLAMIVVGLIVRCVWERFTRPMD